MNFLLVLGGIVCAGESERRAREAGKRIVLVVVRHLVTSQCSDRRRSARTGAAIASTETMPHTKDGPTHTTSRKSSDLPRISCGPVSSVSK